MVWYQHSLHHQSQQQYQHHCDEAGDFKIKRMQERESPVKRQAQEAQQQEQQSPGGQQEQRQAQEAQHEEQEQNKKKNLLRKISWTGSLWSLSISKSRNDSGSSINLRQQIVLKL